MAAGGADIGHGSASHHKPVLPCHTLERYFRNSVRFLASCGGTGQSGEGRAGNTVQTESRQLSLQQQQQQPLQSEVLSQMLINQSVIQVKHGSTQLPRQIWIQVAATPTRSRTSMHLWSSAGVLPLSRSQCALRCEPRDVGCRCGRRRPPRPGCRTETRRCPPTPRV